MKREKEEVRKEECVCQRESGRERGRGSVCVLERERVCALERAGKRERE